MIIKMK